MSPLIELIFTALTHERQAAWPALGIPRWFKPLKILAKGLMTGSKIAITFDTHAGDAASNTDLLRGHAIILNTPVSLPRTAFHSSHLCSSTICFRFHTLEYKGIRGVEKTVRAAYQRLADAATRLGHIRGHLQIPMNI